MPEVCPLSEHPWFALVVKPNHEKSTAMALRQQGFEEYLPLYRDRRRWSDRKKEVDAVLFPRYVFCRFSFDERIRVLRTPGVQTVVSSCRIPLAVADEELSSVRKLILSGAPVRSCPYAAVGSAVVIHDGPLAGVRGIVLREKDAWRVVITIEALHRSVAVEIDRTTLRPAETARWRPGRLEIAS